MIPILLELSFFLVVIATPNIGARKLVRYVAIFDFKDDLSTSINFAQLERELPLLILKASYGLHSGLASRRGSKLPYYFQQTQQKLIGQ